MPLVHLNKDLTIVTDGAGKRSGIIDLTARLPRLLLHGQRAGTSGLGSGYCYVHARWSPEERARWELFTQELLNDHDDDGGIDRREASFTAEGKAWLKKHYGGEFKFLRVHGLSIYDDEHREEGRTIARSLMKSDGELQAQRSGSDEPTVT